MLIPKVACMARLLPTSSSIPPTNSTSSSLCLQPPCSSLIHTKRAHSFSLQGSALCPLCLEYLSTTPALSFFTWFNAIHVISTSKLFYQRELLWHSRFVHYFLLMYPNFFLPSLNYSEVSLDSYLNCRFNIYLFNSLIIQPKLQQNLRLCLLVHSCISGTKWLFNSF